MNLQLGEDEEDFNPAKQKQSNQAYHKVQVHHLPFRVDHDGHAAVSTCFVVRRVADEYETSFRGRRLCGRRCDLPEGCFGFLIKREMRDDSDDNESNEDDEEEERPPSEGTFLAARDGFDHVMDWSLHRKQHEPLGDWQNWLEISRAVHGEDEDEVL